MKLRYSPSSPFVRKVWLAVLELGLEDRVEQVPTNPLAREDVVNSPNPLGKVPCLETDDGAVLYDSPVIIEYLDAEFGGNRLIPATGPERWTALRRQALADGMIEAMVACFIEGLRKPERQSRGWIGHNRNALVRALKAMEGEADALGGDVSAGHLTMAVALEMADIHFAELDWRAGHPRLAAWFESFRQRPSMQANPLPDPREKPTDN